MARPALVTGTNEIQTTTTAGATTNFTYDSGATGSDRVLVVGVPYEMGTNITVSGITYNGVSMTQAIHVDGGGSASTEENLDIWVLAAPTTGSNTLTVSLNNSNNQDLGVLLATYSGADQSTIFGATSFNAESGTPEDPELLDLVTTTADSTAIFVNVQNSALQTLTVSGEGTDIANGNTGGSFGFTAMLVEVDATTATTHTSGFTTTSTSFITVIAAVEILAASSITAAITGTAADNITEDDVVTGGKTVIITLTGDTWVADGATFDAQRQNIIDGLDSAQSELTGWNNEVRDNEVVGAVVRTSDTVVTITLTAAASYDITVQETITVTVPNTALVTSAGDITGSPTFTVDPVAVGFNAYFAIGSGGLIQ